MNRIRAGDAGVRRNRGAGRAIVWLALACASCSGGENGSQNPRSSSGGGPPTAAAPQLAAPPPQSASAVGSPPLANGTRTDAPPAPDVELPFSFPIGNLVVAGGGRYVIVVPQEDGSAVVVDVAQRKTLAEIPYSRGMTVFGGATRVVTYFGSNFRQEWVRYRLIDGKREWSVTRGGAASTRRGALGFDSEGPLYLTSHDNVPMDFIDLQTLRPRPLDEDTIPAVKKAIRSFGDEIRATPDGKKVYADRGLLDLTGLKPTLVPYDDVDDVEDVSRDGRFFYFRSGIKNLDGEVVVPATRPIGGAMRGYVCCIDAPYFVREQETGRTAALQFFVPNVAAPIREMPVKRLTLYAPNLTVLSSRWQTFAAVDETRKLLALKHVDLDAALAAFSGDYFYFGHIDVPGAAKDRSWQLPLKVFSKAGPLSFRIDAGPPGMAVSATGVMTWTPSDSRGAEATVSVTDPNGRKLVRKMQIPGGFAPTVAPNYEEGGVVVEGVVVDASIGKRELRLSEPAARIWPVAGGKYLAAYLPTARKIAVIDVRGARIERDIGLEAGAEPVAFGRTQFAVFDKAANRLSIADFETGKSKSNVVLEKKPESFAMGSDGEGPLAIAFRKSKRGNRPLETTFFDLATLKPILHNGYVRPVDGEVEFKARADGIGFLPRNGGGYATLLSTVAAANEKPHGQPEYVPPTQQLWGAETYNYQSYVTDGGRREADAKLDLYASWQVDVPPSNDDSPPPAGTFTVHQFHRTGTLFNVTNLELPAIPPQLTDRREQDKFLKEGRIFLSLEAAAIATVPGPWDRLVFHTVDLDEILPRVAGEASRKADGTTAEAFPPRPLVVSSVPMPIAPGVMWKHRLRGYSKAGGVQYQLEYAPPGMSISPTGEMEWNIPDRDSYNRPQSDVDVVISVRDPAGEETLHRLKLVLWIPELTARTLPGPAPSGIPGGGGRPQPPVAAVPPRPHQEIPMPNTIGAWTLGGKGRYLAAHIPQDGIVVVTDLLEKKIAATILVPHIEQIDLAAGATKLVVADKVRREVVSYALATGTKQSSYVVPGFGIAHIALGLASEGPVLVAVRNAAPQSPQASRGPPCRVEFLDLATLRPRAMNFTEGNAVNGEGWTASSDGRVFMGYYSGTFTLYGNVVHRNSIENVVPAPDGRLLDTAGRYHRYPDDPPGEPVQDEPGRRRYPAATGTLLLNYRYFGNDPVGRYFVQVQGSPHGIVELRGIPPAEQAPNENGFREPVPIEMIVGLVPEVGALVLLNPKRNGLLVFPFDLDEELAKSEVDYLFILTVPPENIPPDVAFSHQVVAKAKRGGVTMRLAEGPAGMTLSDAGLLAWPKPVAGVHRVTILATDAAGQEFRQSVRIVVGVPPLQPPAAR
jgi:hypothetical protein